MKRILLYILVIVLIMPFTSTASEISKNVKPLKVDISNRILIYNGDSLKQEDIDSIIRYDKLGYDFVYVKDYNKKITSFKDYYLFVKMDTINEENQSYFLSIDPSITNVDLWFIGGDDTLGKIKSGTFTPVEQRDFAPEVMKNMFHVDYNHDYPYFILKVTGEIKSLPPNFRAELLEMDQYFGKLVERKVWKGFLYGFIALIALHGFILFYFLKIYTFLFYGLFTALAILTMTYINKDLADFIFYQFPGTSPKYFFFARIFVYAFAISYLLFIWYATRKNITFEKWRKIVYWIMLAAVPLLIFDLILGYRTNYDPNITVILLNNYMFIVSLATLIFATQVIIKKQRRYFLFAIGIIFMAIGIFATGIVRLNSWIFTSFYFNTGVVLEVIFFSFGLGYNYYLLNKKTRIAESDNNSLLSHKVQNDEFLLKVYNFLKKSLSKPELSVEDICENLSVSKAMLYRKLKEETDLTPMQMLNQLKMEKGMDKLNTTRLNISEIAYDLGFADPNYFTRRFTKHFGNPPSYYRITK